MDNRNSLENTIHFQQLDRDAQKVGAWQAKLALAQYYLNKKNKESTDTTSAKELLDAVVKSNTEYSAMAAILLRKISAESAIDELNIEQEQSSIIGSQLGSAFKKNHSPEILYKQYRAQFHNHIAAKTVADLGQFKTDFESLLNRSELTDTLKAKILFQLVHLNLQLAKETGQNYYLNQAIASCDRLISDANLNQMNKAKMADSIKNRIDKSSPENNKIIDTGFISFMKDTVADPLMRLSRFFSKYLGLAIGNIMDMGLFLLPKIFDKRTGNDSYSVAIFFKGAGFGLLGKWVGKNILSKIVAAPLILLAAPIFALAYPFVKLYDLFSNQKAVRDVATDILGKKKSDLSDVPGASQVSSTQNLKDAFALNKEKQNQRFSVGRINQNLKFDKELASEVQYKTEGNKVSFAYGRLFGEMRNQVTAPSTPQPFYAPPTPKAN